MRISDSPTRTSFATGTTASYHGAEAHTPPQLLPPVRAGSASGRAALAQHLGSRGLAGVAPAAARRLPRPTAVQVRETPHPAGASCLYCQNFSIARENSGFAMYSSMIFAYSAGWSVASRMRLMSASDG